MCCLQEALEQEARSIELRVSDIQQVLGDLKVHLYAKFGDNINLEADESWTLKRHWRLRSTWTLLFSFYLITSTKWVFPTKSGLGMNNRFSAVWRKCSWINPQKQILVSIWCLLNSCSVSSVNLTPAGVSWEPDFCFGRLKHGAQSFSPDPRSTGRQEAGRGFMPFWVFTCWKTFWIFFWDTDLIQNSPPGCLAKAIINKHETALSESKHQFSAAQHSETRSRAGPPTQIYLLAQLVKSQLRGEYMEMAALFSHMVLFTWCLPHLLISDTQDEIHGCRHLWSML